MGELLLNMKIWTTKNGEEIKVRDMTTSHIENCIKMLQRSIDEGTVGHEIGFMGSDNMDIDFDWVDDSDEYKAWIRTFKKELKRRNLKDAYIDSLWDKN